jgi:glycosyltransferase involved in cell wall biosynthesis
VPLSILEAKYPTPLISVVMNGYNSEKYLREAIDSVLNQTWTNWEIVFWDNCSEDRTLDIVESYQDSRIHFYCAPCLMPLSTGRNEAIQRCEGEWIAFLDCDDIWLSEKLEKQINLLEGSSKNNIGLIYARTLSFSESGDEGEAIYKYHNRSLPSGNIFQALLSEGNLVPIVSALVSKQAVNRVGAIPEIYTFAEDYWLFVSIAAHYEVLCVQEICCRYRVHSGSATFKNKLKSHQEALAIVQLWQESIEPKKYNKRCAEYHTLIGIERIRLKGMRVRGFREIIEKGSLLFLMRGAITTLYRYWFKRQRPYS